jgi:hypothetical protein
MSFFQDQIISNNLSRKERRTTHFTHLESSILEKSRQETLVKRELMGKPPETKKIYDDELVRAISE